MSIALYPGSFDPCTNGHIDIAVRSARLFDKLYVAVLCNCEKKPTFTADERVELLRKSTADIKNIEVIKFDGLLVSITRAVNANVIIKGLRAMSDFEYEFQMSLTNSKLAPDIETLFLTTSSDNSFLSSSMVKEVARHGGNIAPFVPAAIESEIIQKLMRK